MLSQLASRLTNSAEPRVHPKPLEGLHNHNTLPNPDVAQPLPCVKVGLFATEVQIRASIL